MKKMMLSGIAASIILVSIVSAMEADTVLTAEQERWIEFQLASTLTEAQQQAIITLAGASEISEVSNTLEQVEKVKDHVAALIEGLKKAHETRSGTARKIGRAIGHAPLLAKIFKSEVTLKTDDHAKTPEELMDKLAVIATLETEDIDAMLEVAPSAKTEEIETLKARMEKLDTNLGRFIEVLKAMKARKEQAQTGDCVML